MMQKPVCAVIIPLPEGQKAPPHKALASIKEADDGAVFSSLHVIAAEFCGNPARMRNAAAAKALAGGAEWILYLEDEKLARHAFHLLAPALQNYDVIWGALGIEDDSGNVKIPKITRLACRDMPGLHHMALQWWVGKTHMISAATARAIKFDSGSGAAWYADYMLRLWGRYNCLKTAQGLSIASALPPVGTADKKRLIEDLAATPRFISFACGTREIKLPYTGRNPALEREQLRGVFYEQGDLDALRAFIKPGGVIVDVGANTGNHTVFFAAILKAKKVIPIEPNPATIGFLKSTLEANGLANVDLSLYGIGVGAVSATAQITTGRRGHLGTATLQPGTGKIRVEPLDDLIKERVDLLKIDVESMEVEVLEGARQLILRERPVILIEVVDENIMSFLDMTQKLGYKTQMIFADHGYANYLLLPGAREGGG